jgi:hypothetical protein
LVLAILEERGFLPELRRQLVASPDRPAHVVLPELAAGFHWLLAQHAELVALFFAAGRANPAVRAALQGFVAEGRQLLADYLATRVTAGELREHDTRATAQCCCQPWRWARSPGRPWTPPPWSTCYCAA